MAGGFADGPATKLTLHQVLLVLGMLCTGCINNLVKKYAYDTSSKGLHGITHRFAKPWTMTWVMFWGEFLCLLFFLLKVAAKKRMNRSSKELAYGGEELLLDAKPAEDVNHPITWRSTFVCFLPAMCDIFGTTLSGIGLLYIQVSFFNLFRGAIIIFVGIFSVVVFKRKQFLYQWLGIACCVLGLVLTGVASAHDTPASSSASKAVIGCVLVVAGMLASAVQMVVEEKYLKGRNLPPDFVVGTEGMFGIVVMTCVVLPIVAHVPGHDGDGVRENSIDAAVMFNNSERIQGLVLTYWVSIAFYNFCGLAVAKSLSAVHRTLVDACCTILVWSIDTILYYVTHHEYGEPWAGRWSALEIVGFGCMVFGSATYYAVLKFKCLTYATPQTPKLSSAPDYVEIQSSSY